jgi:hypothetical protein
MDVRNEVCEIVYRTAVNDGKVKWRYSLELIYKIGKPDKRNYV